MDRFDEDTSTIDFNIINKLAKDSLTKNLNSVDVSGSFFLIFLFFVLLSNSVFNF
jgi:hypothetical protein